jgi:8-oxo-dGTP diphosphatase
MIRVVAAVITRGGRVLACRRPEGVDHAGCWEFPGGKVESGESGPEALRRELREELAIEADVGPLVWTTSHRYPGRPPVAIEFYAVDRFAGDVDEGAFAEVRWALPDSLPALDFLEADRELVAALATGVLPLDDVGRATLALRRIRRGRRRPVDRAFGRDPTSLAAEPMPPGLAQGGATFRKSSSETGGR